MLRQTDDQAAHNIDDKDQDRRNGIALDEFRGTVHGTIEIGFLGDFLTAALGLFIAQNAGIQVGVDRHLLAGHGIKSEARRHFRYAAGTAGHDHQIDDDQNDKHKDTDGVIAGNDEFAKRLDHLSGRIRTGMALAEDNAGRGHIQPQSQYCCDQQQAGEGREIQRALRMHCHHQDQQRHKDV